MNYGKLNSALGAVQRLIKETTADSHAPLYITNALEAIAKDISEGLDLAHNRKLVAYEMVVCLEVGERIGRINGKAVLEGFSEDFGWQERMAGEIPLEPERITRWLKGWDESSAKAALALVTTLPAAAVAPVELPKAA